MFFKFLDKKSLEMKYSFKHKNLTNTLSIKQREHREHWENEEHQEHEYK